MAEGSLEVKLQPLLAEDVADDLAPGGKLAKLYENYCARAYLYRSSCHIFIDERRRLSNWRNAVAPALADAGAHNDEITPERAIQTMQQKRPASLQRQRAVSRPTPVSAS